MGKLFQRYIKKGTDKSTPTYTPIPTPTQTPTNSAGDITTNKGDINQESAPKPPIPQKDHYEVEAEKLGFFGLAKNLANALVTWNSAGRPVVTTEQWNHRLSICRGCEFWQEVGQTKVARCKKCGCSSGKLLLGTSNCPLNPPKWTSV